ncbi:WD40-repeat-containing domain protein [Vararia minispora EC-137]|uniref:WD40-repeat-containing domain protein n=1 Tax=Vararia minispora EC-137 TaxID=1314806 RepID=A0ACB8QT07_9AGAM|nr:WD40-repeat-containing domain protein [Vararia minispora EC-137]
MSTSPLPLLLPQDLAKAITSEPGPSEWRPKCYLQSPQPAPPDENRLDLEQAVARQVVDGKVLKKTRPRRTVDHSGAMGRWNLMRRRHTSMKAVPYMRPRPPYIIDLLPPKAYPDNNSTSLCTKFIHTSTNKIRCPVNVVTWTPEGRRVLTGSTSGEFTLWNGLTFNFETILQAHDNAIRAMRFSHSGAYIASADQSGVIKYFQPNMNNLTAWQGHREAVRGLSFSPDDSRFVTASDDSTIALWSFETQEKERALTGHGWDVRCVEWHPYKGLLVSGSKDNQMKFWDPRTGTALTTLRQHKNTVQALAWSPSGNMIASASRDQTVRVFDIRVMKELCILRGHKKEVCSVAWHPVHQVLVSGGSEGALLYWDLSLPAPSAAPAPALAAGDPGSHTRNAPTYGPRATLSQAHDSNIWSLAFHPLGHLLVTASNDHTTRFWARERPGEAGAAADAKPPGEAADDGDEDEDDVLPGLGGGWLAGADGAEDDDGPPGLSGMELPGFGLEQPPPRAPQPPQEEAFAGAEGGGTPGPGPSGFGAFRGRGRGGEFGNGPGSGWRGGRGWGSRRGRF